MKEPDTAQTKSEEIEDENELNETEEVKTNSIIEVEPPKTTKKIKRQIDPEFKKQKRKLDKLKSRKKRARIIVRNLAFDVSITIYKGLVMHANDQPISLIFS